MYGKQQVQEELGVLTENYLIMKALLGDDSDNLSGVKGLGPKTLVKEFSRIVDDPKFSLWDIYEICEQKLQTKKIFAQIIDDWDKVKLNYEMMNLLEPRLSQEEILFILSKIKEPTTTLQTIAFTNMLQSDQIEGLNKNVEAWLEMFRPLTTYKK